MLRQLSKPFLERRGFSTNSFAMITNYLENNNSRCLPKIPILISSMPSPVQFDSTKVKARMSCNAVLPFPVPSNAKNGRYIRPGESQ